MSAGESHPHVPAVPKGFKRKVVLRSWVYSPMRSQRSPRKSEIDRHVFYQPWDDVADRPAGKNLCSLSQQDSVEEYIRLHPQMGLTLDSFCFDRYRAPF